MTPTKLSEGDRALWREIAFEVAAIVIETHVKTCPHGKAMARWKAMVIGICIGAGLAGGVGGFSLAKILM